MPMGQQMMANMAMQYGGDLKHKGSDIIGKYIDPSSLKLYFQVDTAYGRVLVFMIFCLFVAFSELK